MLKRKTMLYNFYLFLRVLFVFRKSFIVAIISYPLEAQTIIMINKMATMTPMIIIIFMFCHQYFLFSLVAYNMKAF